uniref:thioredoxin domain-containing protein n=1 Tax=Nocardioides sp. TaxID=35761 RepID=UPI00356A5655
AYLNEHFVNIKVDREERPDVDAVYMNATTAMTGHGGWPMTCVLDHEGNPWFAGTYFPDTPRHGQPSFSQVLASLTEAWRDRRDDVHRVGGNLREHLASMKTGAAGSITPELLETAQSALAQQYDAVNAGFGGAPKFPPSMVLEFLRRRGTEDGADEMVTGTLTAMAGGGIYDQLGGGFARYSVDATWTVPHFEKMLYDNAQLLGLYARAGGPAFARIARETADFMIGELGTEQGGFASALDADSEGEEGRFYAWTPGQLMEVLGPEDGVWAGEVFAVTVQGTFEHGTSVLQLPRGLPEDEGRFEDVRRRLLAARATRVRPERDDKVVAAWNGLAISGLCDAGLLLGESAYLDAAVAAGDLLASLHLDATGRLLRVSRDGVAGRHAGVLEDHGCVASGFLSLAQATGDGVWLERARLVLDSALDRFGADDGGFFDTAVDAEALVARPRDPGDNASPSGLSSMIHALVDAHALSGDGRYREAAEAALATVAELATRAPRFVGWSLAAAQTMGAGGPLEVAVLGPAGPERAALAHRARQHPGAVVIEADAARDDIPLLSGRTAVDGRPAAYVCRGFVCERPVTSMPELEVLLG